MKYIFSFYQIIYSLFTHFIMFFPGSIGRKLRLSYWKSKLKYLGANVFFDIGIDITGCEKILIGYNFMLGRDCCIGSVDSDGVYIGNDVSIARGSYLHASNHKFSELDVPINKQGVTYNSISFKNANYSIVIEDDVWIGSNSVILSGAHISTGCVISAGSVVSGFYPPYSIIIGNPARLAGSRKKLTNKKYNEH